MSKTQAVIKSFGKLRQSFILTTVPSNIQAFHTDLSTRIDDYNELRTEADPAKMVNEIVLKDNEKLNPIFSNFCDSGVKYFE
jgi:hypothetical protein